MMQTQALDGNIVLSGRNGSDINAIGLVGGKYLVDHAGSGMIETIEYDQNGILVICTVDVVELETNGACIDYLGCFSRITSRWSRYRPVAGKHCYREEEEAEVKD